MAGTGTERRRYPRFKAEPGTSIVCTREPGGPNLIQRIIDVSAVGTCAECTAPLPEGMPVRIEITLPGAKSPMAIRGKVRWITKLQSKGREAHVAGLEFESLVEGLGARKSESAVLDIFLTLRVAVAQLRLYPKDSPQVLKVATDAYHSIHSFLETSGSLTVSRTPRGLLVNGRPLPERGTVTDSVEATMTQLLNDSQVKSVTFRKGISLDELVTFLNALTKKFWDVKDGKEINRRLREERVNQVTVDEVQYVALGEGDIVIEDAARKLAGGATELARVLSSLDQILETATEDGVASEARLHLMKRLVQQDPALLKEAGAAGEGGPGGAGVPGGGGRDEGRLPTARAQEALGDLARVIKDGSPETREPALRVGKAIVDAFAHDPRVAAMMAAILEEAGAPKEAPAMLAVMGVEDRVQAMLRMPEDERIQSIQQTGSALVEELGALGRTDLVRAVLEAMAPSLLDRSPKRRLAAARALGSIRRSLEKSAGAEALAVLELAVRNALEVERDAAAYGVLGDLAAFLADVHLRGGATGRVREFLDLLHRHYTIKEPSFPARNPLAYAVLERVSAGSGFLSLADKIRLGDEGAMGILEALGAAATRFLVREIRSAENPARRAALASYIGKAGAGAATMLMDELQKATSAQDVIHFIEVLPHAMSVELGEMALAGLLRHASAMVRKRAAAGLADSAAPRAGALLQDGLAAEADAGVKASIVEALGRVRHRPAVEILLKMLEDRALPDELRIAAAASLGRIGDARAVPILVRTYSKGEKGLTKIFRSVPAAVRAGAARALASFPTVKEARDAMRTAREDADPSVRAVAQQALYAPLQDCFGERSLAVQPVAEPLEIVAGQKTGGALAELPIETLLTRLAELEARGTLHLAFGGPTARVGMDAGLVVAIEFEGRRDQEAAPFLAGRREGYWLFQPEDRPASRRMLMPVETLLETMKRARPGSSATFPAQ